MSQTSKILIVIIIVTFFACMDCINFYYAIAKEGTKSYNKGYIQGQLDHARTMSEFQNQQARNKNE